MKTTTGKYKKRCQGNSTLLQSGDGEKDPDPELESTASLLFNNTSLGARRVNKRKRLNVDAAGIDNITDRRDEWVLKIKTDTTQRMVLV